MQPQVYIDGPPELLRCVQMNIETFAQVIKTQAAIARFNASGYCTV